MSIDLKEELTARVRELGATILGDGVDQADLLALAARAGELYAQALLTPGGVDDRACKAALAIIAERAEGRAAAVARAQLKEALHFGLDLLRAGLRGGL